MNYTVKRIDRTACSDIHIPNEPFLLCGRMLPSYNGEWTYKVLYFEEKDITEMVFPDENYDFDILSETSFFVGAYGKSGECIGIAIFQKSWNKYLYLYDLKVNAAYRHCGIGRALIGEGKKLAVEQGYNGLYTQAQDNNVIACLFYVNVGFQIGGIDTMVYKGTKQEGKYDILFYLDI